MNGRAGAAAGLTGLAVLLAGLLMPPQLLVTGQVDPRGWLWPVLAGLLVLAIAAWRWRWRWSAGRLAAALLTIAVPPGLLCLSASADDGGRGARWAAGSPGDLPLSAIRPRLGILSGPVLHGPMRGGAPLWQALARSFAPRPLDALDAGSLAGLEALLVVQPRALAPEELVALDDWVRLGGRAVLLADPDLRWADARPLGHPLRAPPVSMLGPLLAHWGLDLAPIVSHRIERRVLDDGRMIQIAGASQLFPKTSECEASFAGLVARCRIGRGTAIVVADADFANDALWTTTPENPLRISGWTSDAVPFLADLLASGAGEGAGKRVWLARADGLPAALRPALLALLLLSAATAILPSPRRPKRKIGRPVPG